MEKWTSLDNKQLKKDPIISNIIKKIGNQTLKKRRGYYPSLVRSIISQQISVAAARSIRNRLYKKVNYRLTPINVLRLKLKDFKKIGLSKQKRSYIFDLSSKIKKKEINFRKLAGLDDEQVIEDLTKIKGIGRWTAEMFLIFCLGRKNILPVDDLGIKRAMMVNYNKKQLPDPKQMVKIAKNWEPYRSLGCWYMWQSLK